jgi:hypothetical protein
MVFLILRFRSHANKHALKRKVIQVLVWNIGVSINFLKKGTPSIPKKPLNFAGQQLTTSTMICTYNMFTDLYKYKCNGRVLQDESDDTIYTS